MRVDGIVWPVCPFRWDAVEEVPGKALVQSNIVCRPGRVGNYTVRPVMVRLMFRFDMNCCSFTIMCFN